MSRMRSPRPRRRPRSVRTSAATWKRRIDDGVRPERSGKRDGRPPVRCRLRQGAGSGGYAERLVSLVRDPYPGAWPRNEELGVDTQLSFYAVYACVTLIANDIGKLRPRLLELADGIWTEVQSPSFSPVLRKPNRFQNHIQFKEWWITSKLTRGNTYALKQRDGRGVVTALYLLDPAKVTPLVTEQGGIYYRLNTDNIAGIEDEV